MTPAGWQTAMLRRRPEAIQCFRNTDTLTFGHKS